MSKPLLVGLTGGIGSGKSTVAKVFESLGAPVFNSDVIAKKIVNSDIDVINEIIEEFGDVYLDGKLDKVKMADIVFNDNTALKKLNKIVHPKVATCFEDWVDRNKTKKILVKEAAILIESGAYKQMNKIVVVTAPKSIRIERVVNRDHTTKEKVIERIDSQFSDEKRAGFANYSIDNGGDLLVIPQVLAIYNTLISLK
jgi:dephospho-CoA kinase